MIMSTKVKNGAIGSFWGIIGFIILMTVIVIPSYNNYYIRNVESNIKYFSIPEQSNIQIEKLLESRQEEHKASPIMRQTQLSPRVVLTSSDSININLEELNFKLSDQYKTSIELFKTKAIEKKSPEKAFKKFIEAFGLSIDENGNIIDVTGNIVSNDNIMCQVVGYFPDKPYIKPNCGF
jgi:hypothetical protein